MMKSVWKSCSFSIFIVDLLLVLNSMAWAADQQNIVTEEFLQQNTGEIKSMTVQVQKLQRENEEILKGINYLRIRIHKKGGGRRPDLELVVDCLEGRGKCEDKCGKTCKKRCANACNEEE